MFFCPNMVHGDNQHVFGTMQYGTLEMRARVAWVQTMHATLVLMGWHFMGWAIPGNIG